MSLTHWHSFFVSCSEFQAGLRTLHYSLSRITLYRVSASKFIALIQFCFKSAGETKVIIRKFKLRRQSKNWTSGCVGVREGEKLPIIRDTSVRKWLFETRGFDLFWNEAVCGRCERGTYGRIFQCSGQRMGQPGAISPFSVYSARRAITSEGLINAVELWATTRACFQSDPNFIFIRLPWNVITSFFLNRSPCDSCVENHTQTSLE